MGASNRNFRWQRTKTYNIAYWLHKKTASWRGWTNFRQVPSSRLQNIVLDTRKKTIKCQVFLWNIETIWHPPMDARPAINCHSQGFELVQWVILSLRTQGQNCSRLWRQTEHWILLFGCSKSLPALFFSSVFYFRFPVVSDLKSACCKRLHLCRMISKAPWKKRWTRCSRPRRQGGLSVMLLGLKLVSFA